MNTLVKNMNIKSKACLSGLNRKFEDDILVGEGGVDLGEGVQLSLDMDLILGVKVHLQSLGAIDLVSDSLAYNLGGVYNVFQNSLLHVGQGAGAGAGALLVDAAHGFLAQNGSLTNNNNVAATAQKIT
jgi:hypothetical protein